MGGSLISILSQTCMHAEMPSSCGIFVYEEITLLRPPMFATDKSLLQFRKVKHILNKSKQSKQKANQQYKIYLISLMIDKIE